jgi:Rhodanese-like domain
VQVKIDDVTEVLRFDKAALKVENVKGENAAEPLRDLPRGKEVRIEFTEKDGKKFATRVVAKPPVKLAPEKMMSTEDVEKLVAMGPEKGKYTLIDARPPMKALEGTIPTAINIPFVAFDKMVDKLPKEKDALIIYFCQGVT